MPSVEDLTGTTYQGGDWQLDYKQARITQLVFWSATCFPCHVQLKAQKNVLSRFDKKDVHVAAFSLAPNEVKDSAFIEEHELSYDFALCGDRERAMALQKRYGIKVFPTTLLLDSSGQILFRFTNFRIGDQNRIQAAIEQVLDGEF